MYKKTITYTDYNDVERTEDLYFNISKAELIMMETSVSGGLKNRLEKIVKSPDNVALMEAFRDLVRRSYGVKSEDGKRFIKSKEITDEFEQTEAYSEFVMELLTNPDSASAFINGIIPKGLMKEGDIKALSQG